MEKKQSIFRWLSVAFLAVGFLTYVVYLFCRKPAGMQGTEFEHIGWFIVDVFMIGGAILGLIWPAKFEKLAGFCIVGLSFANLVMSAASDTGCIFLVNNSKISDKFSLWVEFFEGLVSLIAIVCLVVALALPKSAKILGPVGLCAFVALALLVLVEGVRVFAVKSQSGARPWAWGINLFAVTIILLGLAFGLIRYSYLLKGNFEGKE